ncbi:MAG: aminoacyl-tRNA deacylase [Planctomycetota bacterium]
MPQRVFDMMTRAEVPWTLEEHPTAYTAQDLAHVTHTKGANVIKPVVVRIGTRYILCAVPAHHRVDLDAVAHAVGATEEVELVDEASLDDLFPDVDTGAQAPIGELYGMETVMEESLHNSPHDVLFQVGSHKLAIRMAVTDFVRAVNPTLAPISRAG